MMASGGYLNPESDSFESRPNFYIGNHDSDRDQALTDDQYNHVLNTGVSLLMMVGAPLQLTGPTVPLRDNPRYQ